MSRTNQAIDDQILIRLAELFPRFGSLSSKELRTFLDITKARLVEDAPRDFIVRNGVAVQEISCLISGWAVRYTVLSDGRRQILALEMPCSYICVHALCSVQLPFSVQTLTPTLRLAMDVDGVINAMHDMPRLSQIFYAIGCQGLTEAEDRMIGLGRRDATEKISRLIIKVYARLRLAKLAETPNFEFPLRQSHIADTTGLTTVHVNRILRQLRSANIVTIEKGTAEIHDVDGLLALADMSREDLDINPLMPRGWDSLAEYTGEPAISPAR